MVPTEFSKKYCYKGGCLNLALEPDSAELHHALQIVQESNLRPTLYSDVHYTKKEMEQCPFFQLYLPDPLELEDTRVDEYGTKYEGKCDCCGLGGKLVGDVLIDRKFMRKYKMGVVVPEVYVSEELKDAIEASGLTGVSFDHEVKDFKGREMPRFCVMSFHSVLPPMSGSAWLRPFGFPRKCGHDTIYLRSDIQYEQEKLTDAMDFNLTAEYINNYRIPEIVISAKARKVLQANHVFCRYIPVAII